jgi:hypothetical protein
MRTTTRMSRCRYVSEKGYRFFLPECWGGAMNGPNGCYCEPEKTQLCKRMDELEKRVEALKLELRRIKGNHDGS